MKPRTATDIAKALRSCADFLARLDEGQLERFLDGTLSLALIETGPPHRAAPEESTPDLPRPDPGLMLQEVLRTAVSREEALKVVRQKDVTKPVLLSLARRLQVRVERHDGRAALEEKLVEAIVGSRLRSEAIQGVSLKGGSASRDAPPRGREGGTETEEVERHDNDARRLKSAPDEEERPRLVSRGSRRAGRLGLLGNDAQ